jgi:hypothetical protein
MPVEVAGAQVGALPFCQLHLVRRLHAELLPRACLLSRLTLPLRELLLAPGGE